MYDIFPKLNGLKKEALQCTVLHLFWRACQYADPGELVRLKFKDISATDLQ